MCEQRIIGDQDIADAINRTMKRLATAEIELSRLRQVEAKARELALAMGNLEPATVDKRILTRALELLQLLEADNGETAR